MSTNPASAAAAPDDAELEALNASLVGLAQQLAAAQAELATFREAATARRTKRLEALPEAKRVRWSLDVDPQEML